MPENNEQLQNLLNTLSERLGTNPEELKKSAQSGDIAKTLGNMDKKDAEKIKRVLSDKDAASKLLSTPKAQQLLKNLLGEK